MSRTICKCPNCGSFEVDTYRMITGAMWCNKCGFRISHKENNNPFITEVEGQENLVIEVK